MTQTEGMTHVEAIAAAMRFHNLTFEKVKSVRVSETPAKSFHVTMETEDGRVFADEVEG